MGHRGEPDGAVGLGPVEPARHGVLDAGAGGADAEPCTIALKGDNPVVFVGKNLVLSGFSFPGNTERLLTGAVWANESWGRYWGWDAKEVGALVAWLTYAGFLHSRIAYGWKGRHSAYFAIIAFLFVIFTYLGVSYLLPGLHSYA